MWNLDDTTMYEKVCSFSFDKAFTWGSSKDRERREYVRAEAMKVLEFPSDKPDSTKWAFRIFVKKYKVGRDSDTENFIKLILDSFSKQLISDDESKYKKVKLYPDDTIEHVVVIEVGATHVKSQQDEKVVPQSGDVRYHLGRYAQSETEGGNNESAPLKRGAFVRNMPMR